MTAQKRNTAPEESPGAAESLSVLTDKGSVAKSSTTFSMSVFPQHQDKLRSSAVDPAVAAERGYVTADTKAQLERYGFSPAQRRVPALIIPLYGVEAGRVGYQIRPDHPRMINGKPAKYETKAGQGMIIDVPPRTQPRLRDEDRPLVITEGPIKADSAVSHGLDCIALLGVWSWKGGTGKVALPDWDSIALNGRQVYVCFDSDVMVRPQVATAMARLGDFLARRGAEPSYIYLPSICLRQTGTRSDSMTGWRPGTRQRPSSRWPTPRYASPPPRLTGSCAVLRRHPCPTPGWPSTVCTGLTPGSSCATGVVGSIAGKAPTGPRWPSMR